jgi:ABC-type cobalamin/Fe3+-siderophores transport system ATPase subunit
MISEMLLKFGTGPNVAAGPVPIDAVTVFVGPNNSGKSKVLAEIEQFCQSGQLNINNKLLQSLTFTGLPEEEAKKVIETLQDNAGPNEIVQPDGIILASRHHRIRLRYSELLQSVTNPTGRVPQFASWFLHHLTLKLDGPSRVALVNQQPAGDLQNPPRTTLAVLFHDNQKRGEVRRIVHDAFDTYFVIDPTNLGQFRVRLSDRAPDGDMEERNIHAAGVAFHTRASPIDTASDGVKAFTGIIVEMVAGDPRVLLIDEPEAFLHPALANKLGHEISRAAVQSDKRVFASTHSPMFLMGCIQSGAPINIVRLTYRGGVATARVLPSSEILELMRNPLLRSTGVLNGLFYESVIVTESDADRAFYQEINERLLRLRPEWGIPNCLFLNAQGKHTVHTIIRPLRKLGIPTAGVVDVDILKEGGTPWAQLMDATNVPTANRGAMAALRSSIKQAMDATGKDMKRHGGIAILPQSDKEAAENLLDQLADYGVFVVPGGELESWLKPIGALGHGPAWLIDLFTRIGEDPDAAGYLKPSGDDVWKFMAGLQNWLLNPARRGIPL